MQTQHLTDPFFLQAGLPVRTVDLSGRDQIVFLILWSSGTGGPGTARR